MPTTTLDSSILQTLWGYAAILAVVGAVLYVYWAIAFMIIARKTATPNGWMAWVPILNVVLMCRIAKRSAWWILLLLIPLVNLIFVVILWMGVAETCGRPTWTGVLAIIPGVNLILPAYMATAPGKPVVASAVPPPTARPGACAACGAMNEPGEAYCGQCGKPLAAPAAGAGTPAGQSPSPRCAACGAINEPGEAFCGQCGKALTTPSATREPDPRLSPTTPTSSTPGLMVALFAFVLLCIGAWFTYSKLFSHPTAKRLPPALPQRMAGVMKEFPVDTASKSPARPKAVVTQTLKPGTSAKVPSKWLPPGMTPSNLPGMATSIASATYQAQPNDAPVYVHVLDEPGDDRGRGIANVVLSASSGASETGVQVQTQGGETYQGWRINSPQIEIYVLGRTSEKVVIVIYSPDPAAQQTADRLASDVGNGAGLSDYPEVNGSVGDLPASPPDGFTLSEMNTFDTSSLISPEEMKSSLGMAGPDADQWMRQVQRYLPQRITTAEYQDRYRKPWRVAIGNFGGGIRAWTTWNLVRWISGMASMKSVPLPRGDGLMMSQNGETFLLQRNGPCIALVSGPAGASVTQLSALLSGLQF